MEHTASFKVPDCAYSELLLGATECADTIQSLNYLYKE